MGVGGLTRLERREDAKKHCVTGHLFGEKVVCGACEINHTVKETKDMGVGWKRVGVSCCKSLKAEGNEEHGARNKLRLTRKRIAKNKLTGRDL